MLELVFIVRGTANVRKACKPDISTVFKGKKRAEVTALINIMCGFFFFFILVKTDAFIMSSEHESRY